MSDEHICVFDQLAEHDAPANRHTTLTFDQRQRARLRATDDEGRPLALKLERGRVLRGGTRLAGTDGQVLEVRAAHEDVSEVVSDDALTLARAAYHLGNRHVPLQIEQGRVRYLRDHVLDDMLRGLGLLVGHLSAPFEPEAGAYAGGHHHHHHD